MTSAQKNAGLQRVWIFRHPVKTLFLIFGMLSLMCIGFLYWVGYELLANKSCNYWRLNMTKGEKILAALEWANNTNSLAFEITRPETGEKFVGSARQIPYENAETILREQPDCCHVYARGTEKTDHPSEDLRGRDEGVVVLRYLGKYMDHRTGTIRTAPTVSYVDFNFCRK